MNTEDPVNRAAEAPDYIVDRTLGALLNTNARALRGYRAQREQMKKVRSDRSRIDRLEDSVARIEQLLIKVLEK